MGGRLTRLVCSRSLNACSGCVLNWKAIAKLNSQGWQSPVGDASFLCGVLEPGFVVRVLILACRGARPLVLGLLRLLRFLQDASPLQAWGGIRTPAIPLAERVVK